MKQRSIYILKFLFFTLSLCHTAVAQDISTNIQTKTDAANPSVGSVNEEDLVHFGDLIEIDVIGSAEFDWRGSLTAEGFLEQINFVEGTVFGLCKSEKQIADAVSPLFGKILRNPQISVRILDRSNRPVAIISGAIKTPQRLQIKRPVRLNELLVISGGLNDTASGEVQIFRPEKLNCLAQAGESLEKSSPDAERRERFVAAREDNGAQFINIKISDLLSGKPNSNPQILSGDIVTVQDAQPIYVIGGVENPGQLASRSEMTLTRAIATSGGLTKNADPTSISIFRREGSVSDVIRANFEKIKSNEMEDILLKAFDIVEIPVRGSSTGESRPVISPNAFTEHDRQKLPLRIID